MSKECFVKAWAEKITLPTYEIGEADEMPHFLEKRIYQGASGAVYPYRVVEHIQDEITDKEYEAIFLENPYLKIMVLPELGGRIHMAWDKIKQRHFIYYNQVIKPALVGLTGPWISGGIEFNWPQHHRPSTYLPISWKIVKNDDDSQTIWVGENEHMYGLTGMAGFTLYPDAAFLKIKGRVFNGSGKPQTFLWWANPAIKAGEGHQSIFPPDVTAVFDHGKRDVSSFPIATGEYYKVDYSEGVDISRYKNIPVPTSYMAWKSKYDFVGAYDHEEKGGMLHIADYQIAPGKKQWTWGHGEFGKAWDRNLTDEDGPYIELMTGVFTDNQPDFAWIEAYEEKSFTQVFMPYHDLEAVSNANEDIVLYCDLNENFADIQLYATRNIQDWQLFAMIEDEVVYKENIKASPLDIWKKKIIFSSPILSQKLQIIIKDSQGQISLTWSPFKEKMQELPQIAKAPPMPKSVKTIEELWLVGMHIFQYHHATANAMDYWQEALQRDRLDYRCNLAVARHYINQGLVDDALKHLKQALKRITMLNGSPYDGEVFYLLGHVYENLGEYRKAYDSYYKAIWNKAWADKGFFALARLALQKNKINKALAFIGQSIKQNGLNQKAKHLHIVILRRLELNDKAIIQAKKYAKENPLALSCLYELYLLTQKEEYLQNLMHLSQGRSHNHIELSLDYASFKDYEQSLKILQMSPEQDDSMLYYYQAYYAYLKGEESIIKQAIKQADTIKVPPFYPNRTEDIAVLEYAISQNSFKAKMLLGCFFYAKKCYEKAVDLWEEAYKQNADNPILLRNLAIAYYNKLQKPEKALAFMEKALEKEACNSRLFLELDQLYQVLRKNPFERLAVFEKYKDNVKSRDDLFVEYIKLLNISNQYEKAISLLKGRKFHPWEGGEGRVSLEWSISHIMLASQALQSKESQKAIELLQQARIYPENLGEGKLVGTTDNDILYLLGIAYQQLKGNHGLENSFKEAIKGHITLSISQYYNDQPADYIYFQGLSHRQLGDFERAKKCFDKLYEFAENHQEQKAQYDFFAVSLPNLYVFDKDIQSYHDSYCYWLKGLSYMGQGHEIKGKDYLKKALELEPDNSRMIFISKLIKKGLLEE